MSSLWSLQVENAVLESRVARPRAAQKRGPRFIARLGLSPFLLGVSPLTLCAHPASHLDCGPNPRPLELGLDDEKRLRADVHDLYERQANQAAIELLAQGDRLRAEADDSALTMDLVDDLAQRYAISLQATARRIVEETRQDCALAISFRVRGSGTLMPHHLYCSRSFEERFRWKRTGAANSLVAQCVAAGGRSPTIEPLVVNDIHGRAATIAVDPVTTPRAVLVLFRALPKKALVREPTASPA